MAERRTKGSPSPAQGKKQREGGRADAGGQEEAPMPLVKEGAVRIVVFGRLGIQEVIQDVQGMDKER